MINDEEKSRTQRRTSDVRGPSQLSPISTRRRSSRERLDKYRERDSQRHSRRERAESKSDSERDRRNGRRNRYRDERDLEKQRDKEKARERGEGRDRRTKATAAPTATDYHTLEREARNRERLLADQARKRERAADDDDTGVAGAGVELGEDNTAAGGGQEGRSSKRRRHRRRGSSRRRASTVQGDARSGGDKLAAALGGRKMSVKYEGDESDEARATRIEKEREAQRWE